MKEGKPIFVYGTLRLGEFNFRMLEPALCDAPDLNCTTPGHLWFAHPNSYPVAQFLPNSADTIKGDVLWCDEDHIMYKHTEDMELGAGYEMREIKVTLESGEVIDAYGFHYLRTPRSDLFIPDGDWQRAVHEEEMPDDDDSDEWSEYDFEEV